MAFTKVIPKATTLISAGWDAFNNLITDLLSTSNGNGASQIGIEDSAGNMASDNVEDALAEIYSDTATTVTLAETFDENTATTTSLTWGYKGGLFRLDNVVTDVVAGTIGLTDDATNYIEITPSTGAVTKTTSSFTSGNIPLRIVVAASGSQTTSTDKRAWFSQVAAGTTTTSGIVELSTDAEAIAGTSVVKVITPANLTRIGVFYEPQRASFVFKDVDEIYLNAAVYRHEGTTTQFCYWDSQLTYQFTSLGVSDWSYLYLDDSAIVTADTNVISATELIDSTTEPTWSDAKKGWYSGEDRCIMAVLTNGSSEILEFIHTGDIVYYADGITELSLVDIEDVFTDLTITMPSFSTQADVSFGLDPNGSTAFAEAFWRTNGQSGAVGHLIDTSDEDFTPGLHYTHMSVITDSAQIIEIKNSIDGPHTISEVTNGWYFPIGM